MPVGHRLAGFESIDIDLLRGENFVELSIGSPLRTKIDYIFQIAGWPRKIAVAARAIRAIRTISRLVERNVGIAVIDWDVALFTAWYQGVVNSARWKKVSSPSCGPSCPICVKADVWCDTLGVKNSLHFDKDGNNARDMGRLDGAWGLFVLSE